MIIKKWYSKAMELIGRMSAPGIGGSNARLGLKMEGELIVRDADGNIKAKRKLKFK